MDQAAQETSTVDEGYAAYVKARRERVAAEEAEQKIVPGDVTCHIEMEAKTADIILDLIASNIARYGVRTQAFLMRAADSIENGLRAAADAKPG